MKKILSLILLILISSPAYSTCQTTIIRGGVVTGGACKISDLNKKEKDLRPVNKQKNLKKIKSNCPLDMCFTKMYYNHLNK